MLLEHVSAQHIFVVELRAAFVALDSGELFVHLVDVEAQGVLMLELFVTGRTVHTFETAGVDFAQMLVKAFGVFKHDCTQRA